MADKKLIAAIAAGGIPPEDAEDMITRVLEAVHSLLVDEKTVHLDGICSLTAKKPKTIFVLGSRDRKRVQQRKVTMRGAAIVWQSEEWEVDKPIDPQVASYEWGQAIRGAREANS